MISYVKTDLNEFLRFHKALESFENAGLKTWGYLIYESKFVTYWCFRYVTLKSKLKKQSSTPINANRKNINVKLKLSLKCFSLILTPSSGTFPSVGKKWKKLFQIEIFSDEANILTFARCDQKTDKISSVITRLLICSRFYWLILRHVVQKTEQLSRTNPRALTPTSTSIFVLWLFPSKRDSAYDKKEKAQGFTFHLYYPSVFCA